MLRMADLLLVKNSDFPFKWENKEFITTKIVIPYKPVIELEPQEKTIINKPKPFFFISKPLLMQNILVLNKKLFEKHKITEDELKMFQMYRIVANHHVLIFENDQRKIQAYYLQPQQTPNKLSKRVLRILGLLK